MGWNTGSGGGGGAAKKGASVYRSTNQTGASAAVSFDTAIDNDGQWAGGAPTKLTALQDGWHTATAYLEYHGLGTSLARCWIAHYDAFDVLQSVTYAWIGFLYAGGGSPNYAIMTPSGSFKMLAGEYVQLWKDGSIVEAGANMFSLVEA